MYQQEDTDKNSDDLIFIFSIFVCVIFGFGSAFWNMIVHTFLKEIELSEREAFLNGKWPSAVIFLGGTYLAVEIYEMSTA